MGRTARMTATAIILAVLAGWLILRAIQGKFANRSVIFRFLLDLDIFICALALGTTDMTISSRCGLALRYGRPLALIWLGHILNKISPNHCELAIANDLMRDQTSIDILTGKTPP